MNPSEFQTTLIVAALTFVITTLAVGTALVKLLPGMFERREMAFESRMKTEQADKEAERTEKLEESRASTTVLTVMSKNLEAATEALIAQTKYNQVFQQQFAANEKALSENTEALGGIAEHFGVLLRVGSEPLRELMARVKRIDEQGTPPLTKLQQNVDEMKATIQEVHAQVMPPGQIITVLTRIEGDMKSLQAAFESKIKEAVEIKRKTGQLPILSEGG